MDRLKHTGRAIHWAPLTSAAGLALATLAIVRLGDQPVRSDVLLVVSTMIVIGGLCGLHDPARELVHALPVAASRRLIHRLVLLVPAVTFGVIAVRFVTDRLFVDPPPAPGLSALLAFGAVGVAVCTTLTRRIGTRATDAATTVMLTWLAAGLLLEQVDAPFAIAMPWWRWPVLVLLAGVVATAAATTWGPEA